LDELLLLLAHGIVDSFGLDDTSGLVDLKSQNDALRILFARLIFHGMIFWNTWFSFVSLAYLGGTWSALESPKGEGWSIFAAFQYRNLVIASPWLDLNAKLDKRMFFGASASPGQLCGVSGQFAAVQTEKVMKTAETVALYPTVREMARDAADMDGAVLETAVIGTAGSPFDC
jgi:hypothetical protein